MQLIFSRELDAAREVELSVRDAKLFVERFKRCLKNLSIWIG